VVEGVRGIATMEPCITGAGLAGGKRKVEVTGAVSMWRFLMRGRAEGPQEPFCKQIPGLIMPSQASTKGPENKTQKTATVEVYHVRRDAPKGVAFFEHPEKWEDRRDYYRQVATVEVPAAKIGDVDEVLEQAWQCLQHGVDGPGSVIVKTHVERRRSTSVGDVMLTSAGVNEESPETDLRPYEVGTVGFRAIEEENSESSIGDRAPLPIGQPSGGKQSEDRGAEGDSE